MTLHTGLDLVSIASHGAYSETYGSGNGANLAGLCASWGYIEGPPPPRIGRAVGRVALLCNRLIQFNHILRPKIFL